MAAAQELTPTSYIQHHLTFLAQPMREDAGLWTVHVDTLVTTLLAGVLTFGLLWWVVRKASAGVPSMR